MREVAGDRLAGTEKQDLKIATTADVIGAAKKDKRVF
jgi:hypothetical protein